MERSLLLHHPQQHEINNSHVVVTSPASCPSDSTHNEGLAPAQQPPVTPRPAFRSDDTNPYPTTFVQANTTNFKQVVQMLTGSTTPTEQSHQQQQRPDPSPSSRAAAAIPPIRTTQKKQPGFRLYERRNSLKNALMINTLLPGFSSSSSSSPREAALNPPGPGFSPRNLFPRPHQHHNEALSPSVLDFPKLTLSSPVTPLNDDPFGKSSPLLGNSSSSEEERAIAEKGFYFHPSQANTPRDSEPQLLPLFPVTSPKISGTPS
ncbi:hypothetical protein MLD38_000496 [Melastoma candidum]|uniref:Uncharacterized protein n=1 Tax=Melastoma candidum TaxID=119954 RepID=A0ACB9SA20_9MYRT|nr:hypothetical protein MLD38_000496 [Melastoma candidum]